MYQIITFSGAWVSLSVVLSESLSNYPSKTHPPSMAFLAATVHQSRRAERIVEQRHRIEEQSEHTR